MLTNLPEDLRRELEKPENADIFLELNDSEYITRQHHSRATYALGCRGPLCQKAERDRGRTRQERRAEEAGRPYIPVPQHRKHVDREDLLNAVRRWHVQNRTVSPKARKYSPKKVKVAA